MDSAVGFLVVAVIVLFVVLMIREVWCWYWKINEALVVLRNIDSNLQKIVHAQAFLVESAAQGRGAPPSDTVQGRR